MLIVRYGEETPVNHCCSVDSHVEPPCNVIREQRALSSPSGVVSGFLDARNLALLFHVDQLIYRFGSNREVHWADFS